MIMKIKLLICCLLASFVCKAQYPSPRNFYHSIDYINMFEIGHCEGKAMAGPTYCSYFSWDIPDISDEDVQLTGYNVYCCYIQEYEEGMEIPLSEAILVAHTTNTYLQKQDAYTCITWVTALYSDGGESDPSNISNNIDTPLPIDIQDIANQKFVLSYNRQLESIEIKEMENIISIAVYRSDGTKMMFVSPIGSHFIPTKNLEKGIYIVQVTMKDSYIISEKIVIE